MYEPIKISDLVTSYIGDSKEVLKTLPDNSVHCCVTSPPYFGLRSYLPKDHPDKSKEVGLQKKPEEYISGLVDLFREVRRVLRPDGCLWLNLGDSYAANRTYQCNSTKGGPKHSPAQGFDDSAMKVPDGMKQKDLMGIPWMTAFALRADGWWLRSGVPWVKRNAMPESVEDRPGSSLEYVFLLTKTADYFYDREAVMKTAVTDVKTVNWKEKEYDQHFLGSQQENGVKGRPKGVAGYAKKGKRNRRNGDWWFESVGMFHHTETGELLGFDVVPKSYKGAHFACFPPDLVRPMIQASTSVGGCCSECGAPQRRVVEKERVPTRPAVDTKVTGDVMTDGNRDPQRHVTETKTVGWNFDCDCIPATSVPCTVLDPFAGSGTTGQVCQELELNCILIDLNPDYLKLQKERVLGGDK